MTVLDEDKWEEFTTDFINNIEERLNEIKVYTNTSNDKWLRIPINIGRSYVYVNMYKKSLKIVIAEISRDDIIEDLKQNFGDEMTKVKKQEFGQGEKIRVGFNTKEYIGVIREYKDIDNEWETLMDWINESVYIIKRVLKKHQSDIDKAHNL